MDFDNIFAQQNLAERVGFYQACFPNLPSLNMLQHKPFIVKGLASASVYIRLHPVTSVLH